MKNDTLIKLFGFSGTLLNGDQMVRDRWQFLKTNLTQLPKGQLIDIGCGSGAFTLGSGKLGFNALGLSWDKANQDKAMERAQMLDLAKNVNFEIQDVRFLELKPQYFNRFDVAICLETIEHIMNDNKLMVDISKVLKPNGTLLLTSPNFNFVPLGLGDDKDKLSAVEDGGHVRIGYTEERLREMCELAGFEVVKIGYVSGFLSQKLTALLRILTKSFGYVVAWGITFPFRILPVLFDKAITSMTKYPGYSISLVARKK